MGHASYGNNSEQDPQIGEKPDPAAAAKKPQGGQDRPGLEKPPKSFRLPVRTRTRT
jgi:hypothetical protein